MHDCEDSTLPERGRDRVQRRVGPAVEERAAEDREVEGSGGDGGVDGAAAAARHADQVQHDEARVGRPSQLVLWTRIAWSGTHICIYVARRNAWAGVGGGALTVPTT